MTTAQPGKPETVLEGPQRVDVEVVGRFVEQQHVAAAAQHLGQLDAVALTAGDLAHLLLLVAALEAETRHVGAGVDLAVADHHLLLAPADLVEDRGLGVEVSRDWST
jgi:hypothetical protein